MGRSRFVQPDTIRLSLAECRRTRHASLLLKGVPVGDGKYRPATPDEITESEEQVAQAELDADYIVVKKELTAGETRSIWSMLVTDMKVGEAARLDPHMVGATKLLVYLVSWSFVDADGRPVPVSASAIDTLDKDTYAELVAAIDLHEEEIEARHTLLKKTTNGLLNSVST